MQHVFTMEQEEYLSENIAWDYIHYNDNRPTLDLLALKPMSIISLLDEESRFPKVNPRARRPSGRGPVLPSRLGNSPGVACGSLKPLPGIRPAPA